MEIFQQSPCFKQGEKEMEVCVPQGTPKGDIEALANSEAYADYAGRKWRVKNTWRAWPCPKDKSRIHYTLILRSR